MADEYGFEEEKNEPDMEYEEEFSPKEEITEVPKKETKEFKIVSAEEIGNKVDIKIIDALKKVKDPEIDMDIWNLGLIYDMNVEDKNVNIVMTFTSPMCPFGPKIVKDVKNSVKEVGYEEPNVELVFNPLWEPSEEVKEMLGVV